MNPTESAFAFRIMVAAHELGHALAWLHAGFAVESIELSGRGFGTEGSVNLAKPVCRTEDQARGYLAGLLAGREAGARWCDAIGGRHADHAPGCKWDLAAFHRNHQHLNLRHVPERDLRTEARAVVRAHWPRITRLAPRLAEQGALAL